MSKVLVLGASGYIGGAIARKFASEGYTVYGTTKTEGKKNAMGQFEINPIVATAKDTNVWGPYAEKVDIIIEAIADYQDASSAKAIVDHLQGIVKKWPSKLVFYTSGVWVYGPFNGKLSSESDTVNPPKMVEGRPQLENQYTSFGGIVFRPGDVYGGSAGLTGLFFKAATEGNDQVYGDASTHWPLVHVDDIAQAYFLGASQGQQQRGQIFNLVGSNESLGEITSAVSRVVGFKQEEPTDLTPKAKKVPIIRKLLTRTKIISPEENALPEIETPGQVKWMKPDNPFADCLALNQLIDSRKAKKVLGWDPKHSSFVDTVDVNYLAWKSHNPSK